MSNCFFAQTVPVSHFKRKPTQRSVFELFPKESDNIKVSTSRAIDGLRGENAVKLFAIGGGGVKKMAIKKKTASIMWDNLAGSSSLRKWEQNPI